MLLLSLEPFPFKEKHVTELKQYLPQANVVLADGEMFSWYGSRMQNAPAYFSKLITEIAAFKINHVRKAEIMNPNKNNIITFRASLSQ